MTNKTVWVIIIVLVLIVVWWGVKNYEPTPEITEPVKIGVLVPLTGKFANLGEDLKMGLEIGAAEARAETGVNFQFIYEDSAADPKIAVPAANKLVNLDKVPVVIGGPGSSANLAIAPIFEENKTNFIAISSTPKLNEAGEYIFKIHPDIDGEVTRTVSLMIGRGHKKVGIIYDSASDTQTVGKDLFIKQFTAKGGQVVATEGYDSKTIADFRTSLTKIKSAGPDTLYFLAIEKIAGQATRQARELGLTQALFGWSPFDSAEFLNTAGEMAEGVIITAHPFSCSGTKIMQEYCAKFAARTDVKPLQYGADSYTVIKALAEVIEESGATPEAIQAGFLKVKNYDGPNGLLTLDERGNVVDKDFEFRIVKNGQFIKYEQ